MKKFFNKRSLIPMAIISILSAGSAQASDVSSSHMFLKFSGQNVDYIEMYKDAAGCATKRDEVVLVEIDKLTKSSNGIVKLSPEVVNQVSELSANFHCWESPKNELNGLDGTSEPMSKFLNRFVN